MKTITLSSGQLAQKIGSWANSGIDKEELLHELCSFTGLDLSECISCYEAEQARLSDKALDQDTSIIDADCLIQCLKSEQNGIWKRISITMDPEEMTAFAERLIELGEKHQFTALTDWALQLSEYVELHDFQLIEEIIASFPGVITLLEKAEK